MFKKGFLALIIALCAVGTAVAQDQVRIAILVETTGEVSIRRGGEIVEPSIGDEIYERDLVSTGSAGKARIVLNDNSVLRIGPETIMEMRELDLSNERRMNLRARVGRFLVHVSDWVRGRTEAEFETPTSVAGVRGTTVWGNTELDAICALAGDVEVTPKSAPENATSISDGACVQNMGSGSPEPLQPSPEELQGFLEEVTIQ